MQLPAYGPLHVFLTVLSGVFVSGVAVHLFRARRSEAPRVHWYLSALCLLPAIYLLLEVAEYDTASAALQGGLRRCEASVASVFLIIYPGFLVLVTRVGDRWMPRLIALLGIIMLAKSMSSPTGLWLRTIDSIRPSYLPWGEMIYQAHGQTSGWILYTLATWSILTCYGILCALRYRRRPGAVGANALVLFHAFFFVAVVNDMLIDAGVLASVPLGIFSAPILVTGMWWRNAVEETRRAAALRELFQEAADALIVQEAATGVILEGNHAAGHLLGRSPASLAGVCLREHLLGGDQDRYLEMMAQVARERVAQPVIIEVHCRRSTLEDFPVQMSLRFTSLEGRPCIVTSMRDVTALKRAEADKVQLELQMLHAQRLESLGVLAGGIAHDFNNIMTAILGHLDLALAQAPQGQVHGHLTEAGFAVRRAADLCQQMLVYAGKGIPQIGSLDLSVLVSEMGRMLEVTVARNIQLRRELSATLPLVRGDANQLRQVVMNLITNAAEAIGNESGSIDLHTREVTVGGAGAERFVNGPPGSEHCVLIEVRDSGCGMDAATRKRMFEPFFTTKFTGRGLGMSAVLGIVRDHGGALAVDSGVGRGTTISVYLPVQASPAAAVREPAAARTGRVLLVDDDDAVRVLTADMIEHLGGDVVQASSGAEAVHLFSGLHRHFDLAILDVTMPDMDGIGVLGALRGKQPDLPVVLSSGFSPHDVAKWISHQDRVSFLQKPYNLHALKQAMERAQLDPPGSPLAASSARV